MTTIAEQKTMFYEQNHKYCERMSLVSDMIRSKEMTREDLRKLIERWPERYGMFSDIFSNDLNWK